MGLIGHVPRLIGDEPDQLGELGACEAMPLPAAGGIAGMAGDQRPRHDHRWTAALCSIRPPLRSGDAQ